MRRGRGRRAAAWGVATAVVLALGWVLAVVLDGGRSGPVRASLDAASLLGGGDAEGYARATNPRAFRFPEDHGPHPEFRTEWWYLTGNLEDEEGGAFGFQVTFFRSALEPPVGGSPAPAGSPEPGEASAWRTGQAYMGHFGLTDVARDEHHAFERFARGALGLAGARVRPFRVWVEDWSLDGGGEEVFPLTVRAAEEGVELELSIRAGKPPVFQGEMGLSRKGPEPGNASYYYSFTRMPAEGAVTVAGGE